MKILRLFRCALCLSQILPVMASTLERPQEETIDAYRSTIKSAFQRGLDITLEDQDSIEMIAGGLSKADLFKVTTPQGPFIIKIMKDSPDNDILTEINAAHIMSKVGVGPPLHYGDFDTKTLVLGYIQNRDDTGRHETPFHQLVADQIRALHSAKFLDREIHFFEILRQDEQRLMDFGLVLPFLCSEEMALYNERAREVENIFEHFPEDICPVHHDLSPLNVLYDGEKAWLIDWETASNDYYSIDLCMFANFHVYDERLLLDFLEAYYERRVTSLERAKFDVIRPFCYAFHGFRLAFLSKLETVPELGKVLEYKNFQLGIRRGTVEFGSPESLFKLGVATMTKAMAMLRGGSFKAGLSILKTHLELTYQEECTL